MSEAARLRETRRRGEILRTDRGRTIRLGRAVVHQAVAPIATTTKVGRIDSENGLTESLNIKIDFLLK